MDESTLDIREMFKTLQKRRTLILWIFTAFIVLAAVISFLLPPTYEAETALRVKQPKGLSDSLLADLPIGSAANTKQLMSTYAEIIKSRTVVQDVIDKTQSDKDNVPDYEAMLKRITTQPVKDTEILKVKVTAKTPEEAQIVANTLVEAFNSRMTALARAEQSMVRQFIGERLQESKKELERSEDALQRYKREKRIVAPTDETRAIVDRLSQINQLAANSIVNMAAAQGKYASVQQQLSAEKNGFVADSPLIQQYKSKLAELEVQMVSLAQNYTNKHPQVMATRAAINETTAKLNTEIARVINEEAPSMNPIHLALLQSRIQAETEMAAFNAQLTAIKNLTSQGEQELNKLPVKEQGLARVLRDAAVAQEIYIMLAKRHEEARISEVMQPTDVQTIDQAPIPDEPIKPKKALNIAIAAILGLLAGVSLALWLEHMDKAIRTPDDVKHYLDLPILGSIPHYDAKYCAPKPSFWQSIKESTIARVWRGM